MYFRVEGVEFSARRAKEDCFRAGVGATGLVVEGNGTSSVAVGADGIYVGLLSKNLVKIV